MITYNSLVSGSLFTLLHLFSLCLYLSNSMSLTVSLGSHLPETTRNK